MQRAEEPPSGSTTEPTRAPGLSPVKGFLLLGLILAVILGAVALTTGEPEQQATGRPGERTPSFALTDAEALERFDTLNELRIQAYVQRDLGLVSRYLTTDSLLRGVNVDEIHQLIRDQVLFRPHLTVRRTEVISNTDDEIIVEQVVTEYPEFISESGEEVSKSNVGILEVIEWSLHRETDVWKIFDADVVRTRRLTQK